MNVQTMIALCRDGFFVSLVVALAGLIAAVVIFIKFDIRNIWLIRSGRARRQSIEEMNSASRAGGRMRSDQRKFGSDRQGLENDEKREPTAKLDDMIGGGENPPAATETVRTAAAVTAAFHSAMPETAILNQTAPAAGNAVPETAVLGKVEPAEAGSAAPETAILQGAPETAILQGAPETAILHGAPPTGVLGSQPRGTTEELPRVEVCQVRITQEVVVTHCEDSIE